LRALRGLETLGYNYDTGHAWACRERVELLPAKLSGLIYGTHLKDNTQEAPLALAPGKGTIPWDLVLGGLRSAGYAGSWDVEFMCPSAEVQEAYRGGIAKIKDTLNAQGAEQHG
jgi:sugar phosphate isomerase/epimerase